MDDGDSEHLDAIIDFAERAAAIVRRQRVSDPALGSSDAHPVSVPSFN